MVQLPIGALIVIVVLAASGPIGAIYAIRRANNAVRVARDEQRQTRDHVDAHMRALDVLTNPDMLGGGGTKSTDSRHLRLLAAVGTAPVAVGLVRGTVRRHPASVASVVAIAAAASFVALIWPENVADDHLALIQPPPVTNTMPVDVRSESAAPSRSAAPPPVRAPTSVEPKAPTTHGKKTADVLLAAASTTEAAPSTGAAEPRTERPAAQSTTTTTAPTDSSLCTVSVMDAPAVHACVK
jgi:hypothetical protein